MLQALLTSRHYRCSIYPALATPRFACSINGRKAGENESGKALELPLQVRLERGVERAPQSCPYTACNITPKNSPP